MCGIFCQIFGKDIEPQDCDIFYNKTKTLLARRGPNSCRTHFLSKEQIFFAATVLHQQGTFIQPATNDDHILLFSGDLFIDCDDNSDTNYLFQRLCACKSDEKQILKLITCLRGPFSGIYYSRKNQALYFFRDAIGRNSLLVAKSKGSLVISSVLHNNNTVRTMELPALGVYRLLKDKITLFNWYDIGGCDLYSSQLRHLEAILNARVEVKHTLEIEWLQRTPSTHEMYSFEKFNFNSLKDFLEITAIADTCNEVIRLLRASITDRVKATPAYCKTCFTCRLTSCHCSKIGLLFSGGVDCSILALLADTIVNQSEPIDLLNVAFERLNHKTIDWNVPDRLTARNSLDELRKLCPWRQWNFVEINIPRSEMDLAIKRHIRHLIFPLNSVLDESLGTAMWFAARGEGILNGSLYKSTCRVLLVGSGADELFGGYSRHRNTFLRSTATDSTAIDNELEWDFIRLPSRNLARDDRVVCDHGVTIRAPYLEENFVHFIRNLSPMQRCYHGLEPGVGDKLLLRLCVFKLGLESCSRFKKRALQFGSRIADRKQNATDISLKLMKDS